MNGYRTMILARMRPRGDFQRIEMQNLILRAVADKLLRPSAIPKIPELTEAFRGSIQTDLGPVEIGQLICLATLLDIQKIEFLNFPEELFESTRIRDPVLGNTSILKADFDTLKIYVRKFERGTWSGVEEEPRDGITP